MNFKEFLELNESRQDLQYTGVKVLKLFPVILTMKVEESVEPAGDLKWNFSNVKFVEDFAPFKKGEECKSLTIDILGKQISSNSKKANLKFTTE